MTEDACIELARLRLDDRLEPYLWGDEVIVDALRNGLQEAADRGRLIEDRETVALAPGRSGYALLLPALEVLRVMHPDSAIPLRQTTVQQLDASRPQWPHDTGRPTAYVHSAENTLIVTPTPDAEADLVVEVARGITEEDDLAVIPARYHRDLVWWVAFECFSMKDADGEDSPRAQHALSMFERRFGPRKSAVYDRVARALPAGATARISRMA